MSTTNTAILPLTTKASTRPSWMRLSRRSKKARRISEEDRKIIAQLQEALDYANSENAITYTLDELKAKLREDNQKWRDTYSK